MLIWRMLWKDWGFAESLFAQAKYFLELAKAGGAADEGFIRASMLLSQMSFEAYYRSDVIPAYIQNNRKRLSRAALGNVKARTSITHAIQRRHKNLTGNPLDKTAAGY